MKHLLWIGVCFIALQGAAQTPLFSFADMAPAVGQKKLVNTFHNQSIAGMMYFDSTLDSLAAFLKKHNKLTVELGAYIPCAYKGTPITRERTVSIAEGYRKALLGKGADPSRVKSKGYGHSKPLAKCSECEKCPPAVKEKNHRMEIKILNVG